SHLPTGEPRSSLWSSVCVRTHLQWEPLVFLRAMRDDGRTTTLGDRVLPRGKRNDAETHDENHAEVGGMLRRHLRHAALLRSHHPVDMRTMQIDGRRPHAAPSVASLEDA